MPQIHRLEGNDFHRETTFGCLSLCQFLSLRRTIFLICESVATLQRKTILNPWQLYFCEEKQSMAALNE